MNFITCDLCGDYGFKNKNLHSLSAIHKFNELKFLEKKNINRKDLETMEQVHLDKEISDIEDFIKDLQKDGYDCSNCNMIINGTIDNFVEHDKQCYQISRGICPSAIPNQKKYLSNLTASCDLCGKTFTHNSKTMTPKVALNRHKKTCKGGNKNYLKNIRDFLHQADTKQLKEINNLINSFKI